MRLRDAVKYALYVARSVEPSGYADSRHGFGSTALRARFLDVIQKLISYGYTHQTGHTAALMLMLMTPPHTPEGYPAGEKATKEASNTQDLFQRFWNAMRAVSQSDAQGSVLKTSIKQILRKLYVRASSSDTAGSEFEAAFRNCMDATSVAAPKRVRKKQAIKVGRVGDARVAFAYAVQDAVRNRIESYLVMKTEGDRTLRETFSRFKHNVLDYGSMRDFTVVLSSGHGSDGEKVKFRRYYHDRKRDLKVWPGKLTTQELADGASALEVLQDALGKGSPFASKAEGAKGGALGSVVILLIVGTDDPMACANTHAQGGGQTHSVPRVCVYLPSEPAPLVYFATLAVTLAPRMQAQAWGYYMPEKERELAPRCVRKTVKAAGFSSLARHVASGNVALDPSRAGESELTLPTAAEASKAANDKGNGAEVKYNWEVYSKARTYAKDVVAAYSEITLHGDPDDYARSIAKCAGLVLGSQNEEHKLPLSVVDATNLEQKAKKGQPVLAIPEAWLGVLVAMACNPRILLVATQAQHNAIVREIEAVQRYEALPAADAPQRSAGAAETGRSMEGLNSRQAPSTASPRMIEGTDEWKKEEAGHDLEDRAREARQDAYERRLAASARAREIRKRVDEEKEEKEAKLRERELGQEEWRRANPAPLEQKRRGFKRIGLKRPLRKSGARSDVLYAASEDDEAEGEDEKAKPSGLWDTPAPVEEAFLEGYDSDRERAFTADAERIRRERRERESPDKNNQKSTERARGKGPEGQNGDRALEDGETLDGEGGPVFGPPVRIFDEMYEVSETGCDQEGARCTQKDDIVRALHNVVPAKVKFLLVRSSEATKGTIARDHHHAKSGIENTTNVYLRCAADGTVEAEETKNTEKGGTERRLILRPEALSKAIDKIRKEGKGTIYVLCTS